jgi:hypothetical protein
MPTHIALPRMEMLIGWGLVNPYVVTSSHMWNSLHVIPHKYIWICSSSKPFGKTLDLCTQLKKIWKKILMILNI